MPNHDQDADPAESFGILMGSILEFGWTQIFKEIFLYKYWYWNAIYDSKSKTFAEN